MANNPTTVLVKKADGTFVRMTLDEIKKMRSGLASVSPKEPVTSSAGVDFAAKTAAPPPVVKETPRSNSRPLISPNRLNQVEEVLKKLRFKVDGNLQNRLRSIIQLYLKDIRSAEQTKDKVMQPANQGGLGAGEKEAGELVSVCDIILHRTVKENKLDDVPVLKKKKNLPMVEPPELPAVDAPFNAFVHGEKKKELARPNSTPSVFRPVSTVKPVMADVAPPQPVEMGPIEEIEYISLVDFRRLSAKPEEAAARLKQKFINLRDESIVLFLDALAAWHKSPLYLSYMKVVSRALKERRKLSAILGNGGNEIKLEEILAIVKMESELE
jgi:hypothetical protein